MGKSSRSLTSTDDLSEVTALMPLSGNILQAASLVPVRTLTKFGMVWAVIELIGVDGSTVYSNTVLAAGYIGGNSALTWTGRLELEQDAELRARVNGFAVAEFTLTSLTA